MILTFDLPVMYSPHEPVHFLGFLTSWIGIQEEFLNADPCGSGSVTLVGNPNNVLVLDPAF